MIGLTGFSLPIADNTCAHSLGYRPVQDIQRGELETNSRKQTDACIVRNISILWCLMLALAGAGELVADRGRCGCQSEAVGHIWRPSQGSQVENLVFFFRTELAGPGLPTAAQMWFSCALTLGEPSPSKTAGGWK